MLGSWQKPWSLWLGLDLNSGLLTVEQTGSSGWSPWRAKLIKFMDGPQIAGIGIEGIVSPPTISNRTLLRHKDVEEDIAR